MMNTRRREKSAQRMEEAPSAVGCSSAPKVKHPRKRKRIRRQHRRSHGSQAQQPAKGLAKLRVRGKGCSMPDLVYERIASESQEKLRSCCCKNKESLIKLLPESRSGRMPAFKTAEGQGPGIPERKPAETHFSSKIACLEGHPGNPRNFGYARGRPSSKNRSAMENRHYQAVSEYRFRNPGVTIFQCSRESVMQQLRSIYVGGAQHKTLKMTQPFIHLPPWKSSEAQRDDPYDVKCPVGIEFRRSESLETFPDGLINLTHKISNLVLVNRKGDALSGKPSPCSPGSPCAAHEQHKATSEEPPALVELFPMTSSGSSWTNEGEGWSGEPGHRPQAFRSTMLASCTCPRRHLKPRPFSAKNHYEKASAQRPSCTENRDGQASKEGAETPNTPDLSRKTNVIHTRSAIVIPAITLCSSSESYDVETQSTSVANLSCTT